MPAIKDKVIETLNGLTNPKAGIAKRFSGDNTGPFLSDIYIWQVTEAYAGEKKKEAWKTAQTEGFVPSDTQLRGFAEGDHIVADSKQFSCLVKVTRPHGRFNKDEFVAAVARKYKIKMGELLKLVEQYTEPGAVPLTKRVAEVE